MDRRIFTATTTFTQGSPSQVRIALPCLGLWRLRSGFQLRTSGSNATGLVVQIYDEAGNTTANRFTSASGNGGTYVAIGGAWQSGASGVVVPMLEWNATALAVTWESNVTAGTAGDSYKFRGTLEYLGPLNDAIRRLPIGSALTVTTP